MSLSRVEYISFKEINSWDRGTHAFEGVDIRRGATAPERGGAVGPTILVFVEGAFPARLGPKKLRVHIIHVHGLRMERLAAILSRSVATILVPSACGTIIWFISNVDAIVIAAFVDKVGLCFRVIVTLLLVIKGD